MVAEVGPTELGLSTPCDGWAVRDLLNHVVGGAEMFAGALQGGPVHDISGRLPDALGDDPLGAFERAAEHFGAAAQSPGATERVLDLPFGSMQGATFLRFVAFDLLVHSWDLATTLGSELDVPDDVVVGAGRIAHRTLDGRERDGRTFAESTVAPGGATPLERLVAFTGRSVPGRP
nr:TIGR03086 family metal-binding protein [Rhabdothermincola salaria]